MPKVRFAMALHNHQPVGNFGGVFEEAYRDSYLPFLEVMENYPDIPFSLHTSGSLLEWLEQHKTDYIDRLRKLVEREQVEIIGGGFYEPIMAMIPSRDRRGQIRGYTEHLFDLFGTRARGMWLPERVWEQSLVSDIVAAGIEYTILDDFHFQKAGLRSDELTGYYLTEDEGRLLRIFPGSEPMRYMIPFHDVGAVIHQLRQIAESRDDTLVVFADDGEKFGSWPHTKAHVYEHGWIFRFLDALRHNRDWIELCTLSQALDALPPVGRVYLSDCSYREMTEWALRSDRFLRYDELRQQADERGLGEIRDFIKGGFWRNFKTKYPETGEMYSRMMEVSERLDLLTRTDTHAFGDARVHEARQALYRGQCNCPYWHGSFGGLYLPHLRTAIFEQLIQADNKLTEYERGEGAKFVDVCTKDFNFDGYNEIKLENEHLIAYLQPSSGGQLYELDIRMIGINLGSSLARRPEPYHERIRKAGGDGLVQKQQGLLQHIVYDSYPRKSFIDHFFGDAPSVETLQLGKTREAGDFVRGIYESHQSQVGSQIAVTLNRDGKVDDQPVSVTKTFGLGAGSNQTRVKYLLEQLPADRSVRFGIEFNFAALATGADDRYFLNELGERLGGLESKQTLTGAKEIRLVDEWLGIEVGLGCSLPASVYAFPIETVSGSEGGVELVHQSVCVMAVWEIAAGTSTWEVQIDLALNTQMAESRRLVATPMG